MEITSILLLIAGLALLLVNGKFLVESSVSIAGRFRISPGIIGLTIVAFGTSAPELIVSIQAALQGHPDMAMGNVVGSNISNILLVLGLTTIIFPLVVQRSSIVRDWPVMIGVSILLLSFMLDDRLSRLEGFFLVLLLAGYIYLSIRVSKSEPKESRKEIAVLPLKERWYVAMAIFLASCAGLAIGASLLVDHAALMAQHFGISERVISITMIALGTSLPELVTSLIAAFKKETEISIGNILGSNIFNILSVLGITTLIKPIQTSHEMLTVDMPWMIGSALILLLFMLPARKGRINRFEGAFMFLGYVSYVYFLF